MSITYLPLTEQRASDRLEELAHDHNSGWDATAEARHMCPLLPEDEFPLAWRDFCEAVAARDSAAPPATRDWREVLDEDAASNQEDTHQILCQRADEALAYLRTGIRTGIRK